MIPYKQLSLSDTFADCHEKFQEDKYLFLSLLEQHINLDELISISFRNHFYAYTGRHHKYPLKGFIRVLFVQRVFPSLYFISILHFIALHNIYI